MNARRDEPPPDSPVDLAVLLLDTDGHVVAASPAAASQIGRGSEQLRGRTLTEIFRAGADAVPEWLERLVECREPPPPRMLDLELLRADGLQLDYEAVLYAIAVGARESSECVAGLRLRPSGGLVLKSEVLMAQREVLGLVASGADLRTTLTAVAGFAERAMPGEAFCMLSPVNADGVFEESLCPTLPAEVGQLLLGHRAGDDTSPATVAAESGESIIAHDVGEEEPWRAYGLKLHRHGLVAAWTVPVRHTDSGKVRAVLEFLLPTRRAPSRAELSLMRELGEMVRLSLDLLGLAMQVVERSAAQLRAEDESRQRGAKIDALVDTALDAVISIADDGTITLWNCQAESLFGWRTAEVLGKPLSNFVVPPEMREAHRAGLARAAATGTGTLLGRRIEINAIDRAGRRFPVELSINRMPGSSGGFSAFMRDISDRRRVEAAIKASEERLKLVIEASADGIWDLRLDGGGSMASDRCASMLGHDPSRAVPWAPSENPWVHPEDQPAIVKAWRDHIEGRTPRFESEHRRRAADGSLRWVLERAKVVERDAQGRVQRVVGVVSDVTERRALEASLSSAERLESLGMLASGFVRELDELLSGISAHATLTKLAPGIPERVGEGLEVIQALVSRARSMSRSLMSLAPSESAHEAALVHAVQILQEGLSLVRVAVPRTVEIVFEDRSEARDLVRLDPAGLQQAIIHMVLRASEAMGLTGTITLRVRSERRMLAIECLDSARPMTPQECADIAEALDPSGALVGRSGLGMSAARRFAESLGGGLRAEVSAGMNVVTLDIPLEPDAVPLVQPPVVLCEDHPLLRPMLAEAITASGHRVIAMESSDGLTAFLRAEGPGTVAVLDGRAWAGVCETWVSMCELLGWNPVCVLLLDQAPDELPAGVRWLQKPFEIDVLMAAIAGRSTAGGASP